jgi:hypothetical protein
VAKYLTRGPSRPIRTQQRQPRPLGLHPTFILRPRQVDTPYSDATGGHDHVGRLGYCVIGLAIAPGRRFADKPGALTKATFMLSLSTAIDDL